MPKFEVIIKYKGADRYYIEAPNAQEADVEARIRYHSGSADDPLFESIDEIVIGEMTDD